MSNHSPARYRAARARDAADLAAALFAGIILLLLTLYLLEVLPEWARTFSLFGAAGVGSYFAKRVQSGQT